MMHPAPITQVTLLEDRAFVVRETQVEIGAGPTTVRLGPVTPDLLERTATARLLEDSPARVLDLQVRRFRPPAPEEKVRPLEDLRTRLARTRLEASADQALHQAELASLRSLALSMLEELAEDSLYQDLDYTLWEERLRAQEAWELAVAHKCAEIGQLSVGATNELNQATRALEELNTRPQPEQCELLVQLESPRPCRVRLRVDYCVPSACWRAVHSALLNADEDRLELRTGACVWQNTGEDWGDVQLLFSTQTSLQGSAPPPLPVDRLTVRKKGSSTLEEREKVLEVLPFQSPAAQESPRQEIGENLVLRSPDPCTLRSDGRPHRIELFSMESECLMERLVLEGGVYLRSTQTHRAPHPLLPGAVELVREGGRVGRTRTGYVGPGDPFELGWGPEPALSVTRKEEQSSQGKRVLHKVRLHLSNLGQRRRRLEVRECLPVAEVNEVSVAQVLDQTSEARAADRDGVVHWSVELAPGQRRALELAYSVKYR